MPGRIKSGYTVDFFVESIIHGNGGHKTGCYGFDSTVGGIRPGEVTVLTGHSGEGKTTFAINFAKWCLRSKLKVDYYAFENTDQDMLENVIQCFYGIQIYNYATKEVQMSEEDLHRWWIEYNKDEDFQKLNFIDKQKKPSINGYYSLKDLGEIIGDAKEDGVDVIIVDHLHYFVNTTDEKQLAALDRAVRFITEMAKSSNVHVLLVVHPTKPSVDSKGKMADLNMYSGKGSSAITQEASNYLVVKRDYFEEYDKNSNACYRKEVMKVSVEKSRKFGGKEYFILEVAKNRKTYYGDSLIKSKYDTAKNKTFTQEKPTKKKGWEF